MALHRFRQEFGIKNLSYCIQSHWSICHETEELILILFEHITGYHPSYSPNQLTTDKLAKVFFKLHQIPIAGFPDFANENFNINYALGLSDWVNRQVILNDTTHCAEMFEVLDKNKERLMIGLTNLQTWQTQLQKHKCLW